MKLLTLFLIVAAAAIGQARIPGPGGSSPGGGGGITIVAHTSQPNPGGSAVTTSAINTTGANVCFIATSGFSINTCTAPAVSDSKGNTYTPVSSGRPGSIANADVCLYYSKGATVGSGHTATVASGSFSPVAFWCTAGTLTTGGADQTIYGTGLGTTIQPGSVTPSTNNQAIFATASTDTASISSISGSSFVVLESQALVGGASMPLFVGYVIQTTATASNPTFTGGSTGNMEATQSSFK